MPKFLTSQLKEGMVVADHVYTKAGQLIVARNSVLSSQMIAHLHHYKIESVVIISGSIPDRAAMTIQKKKDVEQTHLRKLLESPEYENFRSHYSEGLTVVEQSLNDIIRKNVKIDETSLISDTVHLFEECPSTYSLFGMLHSSKQIDDSTYAHSVNVAIISRLLGSWLGLSKEELNHLTLAGLLHDIGKCKIPPNIIGKPGKLTDIEYAFVKKHTKLGYDILSEQDIDEKIRRAALLHHERFDGTGYPFGYTGNKLGTYESIISIADVYDALTANRCYRSGLCPFDVIATFEQEGLSLYHPGYILTFLDHIAKTYLGSDVLLSDNSIGRIVFSNKQLTRPVILLENGTICNLLEHPEIYIQAIV